MECKHGERGVNQNSLSTIKRPTKCKLYDK